jgi:hypothetical protein
MARITFKGRLIDIEGNILTNYKVVLWYLDPNPLTQDRELGKTLTDSEGEFRFSYSPDPNESLFDDKSAKIKAEIRFLDEKIFETTFTGNFKGEVIDFGIIEVKGPNRGVKGRILDENGKPLSGLVVVALGAGKMKLKNCGIHCGRNIWESVISLLVNDHPGDGWIYGKKQLTKI